MSFAAHAIVHRDPGKPFPIEETGPQRILSGWIGVYSSTSAELRLFCVLIPGDIIGSLKGCFLQALTPVELEPCEDAHTLTDIVTRHCLRLGHYNAMLRITDFVLDVQERLRVAGRLAGDSFEIPLTQQQMGELLGMSTVHVNRTLQALRPLMGMKSHQVRIADPQKLAGMYAN